MGPSLLRVTSLDLVVMLSPRKHVSASSLGGQVVKDLLQQLESNCR